MSKNYCGKKCCESGYGVEEIRLIHWPADQYLIICDCELNCEVCPADFK